MVPVIVYLASQDDDVALGKLEVTWFFSLVGVEGFTAGQGRDILENTAQKQGFFNEIRAAFPGGLTEHTGEMVNQRKKCLECSL